MTKLTLLLAAAALCATITLPCRGGVYSVEDHLEPVMTATQAAVWNDREAEVEQILFKEAFGQNVRARIRMMVLPTIFEDMVFVTEDEGRFRLVQLYLPDIIIRYTHPRIPPHGMPAEPPPDPHKAVVVRNEIALSPSLAGRIIKAWKQLLLQTKYISAKRRYYSDGTKYTLSMEDETGRFVGETWSTTGDMPKLEAMEKVAEDMMLVCDYGATTADNCYRPADTDTLERDVDDLLEKLKAGTP